MAVLKMSFGLVLLLWLIGAAAAAAPSTAASASSHAAAQTRQTMPKKKGVHWAYGAGRIHLMRPSRRQLVSHQLVYVWSSEARQSTPAYQITALAPLELKPCVSAVGSVTRQPLLSRSCTRAHQVSQESPCVRRLWNVDLRKGKSGFHQRAP